MQDLGGTKAQFVYLIKLPSSSLPNVATFIATEFENKWKYSYVNLHPYAWPFVLYYAGMHKNGHPFLQ